MDEETPSEAHGLWHAQLFSSEGALLHELLWVLSLTQSPAYPSAFGASVPAELSPPLVPAVLHGTWTQATNVAVLTEAPIPGEGDSPHRRRYNASAVRVAEAGRVLLRGTFREENGESGAFVALREADDAAHASGLWLGAAHPREEDRAAGVPVNPIRWALSAMMHREGSFPCFGAGFFDDAADVPGKPVLLFSLCGRCEDAAAVHIRKVYEACAGGEAMAVTYSGALSRPSEEGSQRWMLKGTWNNEGAGTGGSFECELKGTGLSVAPAGAVCTCDLCSKPVLPGEARWCCSVCVPLWSCCSACHGAADTLQHPHPLELEMTHPVEYAKGASCATLAWDAFQRFQSRPFLGTRVGASFEWQSYGEIGRLVARFALVLRKSLPEISRKPFLMLDDLSAGYTVAMLGALHLGCIIVPLHGETDVDSLAAVLRETCPAACLASSAAVLHRLHAAESVSSVRVPLIVENVLEFCNKAGTLEENDAPPPVALALEDVTAILFTSGSTGQPKGATFTEELALPSEGVANVQPFVRIDFQSFDPSFLLSVLSTVHCGGQRAFSSVASVLDDMPVVRPTHLGAAPAFWHGLYRDFVCRTTQLHNEAHLPTEQAETQAANEIRMSLGNRLIVATSGGAPISPEARDFIKTRLGIALVDLYGTRETGGIARDGVVHMGVDVYLLPLPELGFEGDPPQGPNARAIGKKYRGEICVRSPRNSPGYWTQGSVKKPDASWTIVDGNAYYRTGDVGEVMLCADGKRLLRVIDRCGGQVKLAQGEWLSPSRVESVLEEFPKVAQALVLGSPDRRFPVAVVVVPPSEVSKDGFGPSELLSELRVWCAHNLLRPLEIPQALHVETVAWTPENGLLTSTFKKRRKALAEKYRTVRDGLYASLDNSSSAAPRTSALSEQFLRLLQEALALPSVSGIDATTTLPQLGMDSIASARLLRILKERGVALTLAQLFEYPLSHLASLLERKWSVSQKLQCVEVDWEAECKLPPDLPQLRARSDSAPKDVLLIGATGFLGPLLAAELLRKHARVHCIARASDDAAATKRVVECMQRAQVWSENFESRIVVHAGDAAIRHFGLEDGTYTGLLQSVCEVFHNAAWVNMALPYSGLRAINVGGTLHAIEFALAAGAGLRFVSSVGAIVAGSSLLETWPSSPPGRISESGSSYGQTKAVAERLLHSAHEKLGLDVSIFRPSAISGTTTSGYSNELDFTLLVLKACALLKCVPKSALERDLHWIPADFVSAAIVELSSHRQQRVFHLSGNGPSLSAVIFELEAVLGIQIEAVQAAQWAEAVAKIPASNAQLHVVKDPLLGLAASLPLEQQEDSSVHLSTAEASKLVGRPWPSASASTHIRKCIEFLVAKQFFSF